MSNSNFSFSNAFLGISPKQSKQLDDMREIQDHAMRILEITKMPNSDPIVTFRADILQHVREIENLLAVDEKAIDWQKLVSDVWDSDRQQYKPTGQGIDWMALVTVEKSEPTKPEKKEKAGNVGSLFSF